MRQMNTNLMRSSGLGKDMHQRETGKPFNHIVLGCRFSRRRVIGANCHLLPLVWMHSDWLFNAVVVAIWNAADDRVVFFLNFASFELRG